MVEAPLPESDERIHRPGSGGRKERERWRGQCSSSRSSCPEILALPIRTQSAQTRRVPRCHLCRRVEVVTMPGRPTRPLRYIGRESDAANRRAPRGRSASSRSRLGIQTANDHAAAESEPSRQTATASPPRGIFPSIDARFDTTRFLGPPLIPRKQRSLDLSCTPRFWPISTPISVPL